MGVGCWDSTNPGQKIALDILFTLYLDLTMLVFWSYNELIPLSLNIRIINEIAIFSNMRASNHAPAMVLHIWQAARRGHYWILNLQRNVMFVEDNIDEYSSFLSYTAISLLMAQSVYKYLQLDTWFVSSTYKGMYLSRKIQAAFRLGLV